VALSTEEQVHRSFHSALIDEADSILIDEARIPLVLAGAAGPEENLAQRADRVTRRLRRFAHFNLDEYGRNISLTDEGARVIESQLGCGNIYAEQNFELYTAINDAITLTTCCIGTSITSLRKKGSSRSMLSKGGSRPTAAGPPDCKPPLKPKSGWRSNSRAASSVALPCRISWPTTNTCAG